MKLTVGTLPTAVYWRRRAVVLGILMIIVIMLWTSCSGSSKSDAGANRASAPASATPESSTSPTATVLTPTTPSVGASQPTGTAPPLGPPASADASGLSPCADTDLLLTAAPETPTAANGAYLKFFLKIKNITDRACTRDLGADHQELYLQSGTTKVWSSDTCNPAHSSEVVTMAPKIEHLYNNNWNGLASNAGCVNRKPPGIGKYELFARLDTKISGPANVQLT